MEGSSTKSRGRWAAATCALAGALACAPDAEGVRDGPEGTDPAADGPLLGGREVPEVTGLVRDVESGAITTYGAVYLWNQTADTSNVTPAWDDFVIPPAPPRPR